MSIATQERRLRGDTAIWLFIGMELITFQAFFTLFLLAWRKQPQLFADGASSLQLLPGLLNTVILLTAGWLVAHATHSPSRGDRYTARKLRAAAGLGLLFILVKFWEWSTHPGTSLSTDSFHFYYYFLTFVHVAHVMLGMGYLMLTAGRADQPEFQQAADSAGAYWHMVDLVWVVLFPLVYLLPRGAA